MSRFGTLFRNSIPPPRQYNPPSFEDIFGEKNIQGGKKGGEEDGGKEMESSQSTEKIAINLKLPGHTGKLKVKLSARELQF